MSRRHRNRDESGNRLYTEKEINDILNNSAAATRERMQMRFKQLVRLAAMTYAIIAGIIAIVVIIKFAIASKESESSMSLKDPKFVAVEYKYGTDGSVLGRKQDDTDFTPTIEDKILTARNKGVAVSIFDINIPSADVGSLFASHCATNHQKESADLRLLRFRVMLLNGDVYELALSKYGECIIFARSENAPILPIEKIVSFRRALSGVAYREDIVADYRRKGYHGLQNDIVAVDSHECMSDEEATRLFYLVSKQAELTRFDWGGVLMVFTFGVWNKFHPFVSLGLTLIGLIILAIIRKKDKK